MKKDHPRIFKAMADGEDCDNVTTLPEWTGSPGYVAREAWQRNIDSAFAALPGMSAEDQAAAVRALQRRLKALTEFDAPTGDSTAGTQPFEF